MSDIIQLRRDIETNWDTINPLLAAGEIALTTNTIPPKMKVGNGTSRWKQLDYFAGIVGEQGPQGATGQTGSKGDQGEQGEQGAAGTAATITVGTVTTGEPGTSVIVTNSGTETAAVLNITIPKGDTGESGSGTGDMLAATYDPIIKAITGKSTVDATPDTTLSALQSLTDVKTPFIPAGFTFAPPTRADRNRTYNYLYVDCCDSAGAAQNPTSFVLTVHQNGSLIYTSSAITTAAFTAAISLTITAGDLIMYAVSNTTGLTGGISISLRMVNR